jgi:hypothetical protein
LQEILEGDAEAVARAAIQRAIAGDSAAMRLVLERVAPAARERTVALALPRVESVRDIPAAVGALLEAAGCGLITPGEAQRLAAVLVDAGRLFELAELEARLAALERRDV